MVRGWSPSKIVSESPDLQPTWPLLLKIKKGGMKILKSSSLKLQGQLELSFAWVVLGWSPFKFVSGNPNLQPTWPLLLKIEKGGMNFCFPLKLLGQLDPSFAKIILWWSPFKILSGSPVLRPRWELLLKIYDSLHIK